MKLQTVTGLVPVAEVGLADGHGHVWITPPRGVAPEARMELNDAALIRGELEDFRAAGGSLIVDCQPGGCGRDGRALARLSEATGVRIAAVTGFHRRIYYPARSWLWSASVEEASACFIGELTAGMHETGGTLPATAIKVAFEGTVEGHTRVLMEAAAAAAQHTGAALLVHTERGENAEALLAFFGDRGVPPSRLYLCHMDKRPDLGLHRELAQAGALLGYDTFVRPQYHPERGVWSLLSQMVAAGLADSVALGLDLALQSMWRRAGGQPGLLALPEQIVPRLRAEGVGEASIAGLAGLNIARRLARQ